MHIRAKLQSNNSVHYSYNGRHIGSTWVRPNGTLGKSHTLRHFIKLYKMTKEFKVPYKPL